jgi:hypothetical protein
MAKLYTIIACLLSLIEFVDFLKLYHWILPTVHDMDPTKFPLYATSPPETQKALLFLTHWVAVAKAFFAFFAFATALSGEPLVRLVACLGGFFASAVTRFGVISTVMTEMVVLEQLDPSLDFMLKTAMAYVNLPLFAIAGVLEYREWSASSQKGKKD